MAFGKISWIVFSCQHANIVIEVFHNDIGCYLNVSWWPKKTAV
jgi:hypothetical protein